MNDPTDRTRAGWTKRRFTVVSGLSALVVLALVGGVWAVAAAFESPEQRAATALPPSPGPLLAEVVSGALERKVSTAATLALEREQSVAVGVGSADGGGSGATVVTQAIPVGTALADADVVLEVNGRPRLATTGLFRYYRDLAPGMTGPDVRQLQKFLGVPPDGFFGSRTETAIRRIYDKAGYAPGQSSAHATGETTKSHAETTEPNTAGAPAPPTLVVPAAELLVFDRLPSYVVSVPPVGDLAADAKLIVESGSFVARADVPLSFAYEMKPELPVSIDYQGTVMNGAVRSVGEAPGKATGADGDAAGESGGSDQKRVQYALDPDAPVDFSWRGREVVVTAVLVTAAEDALIVPSIAVVTDRGAQAHVRKQTKGGGFVDIEVTEIATLDGKSAIAPVKKDYLVSGDHVRTG
jgi:hypothetical protein